RWWPPWNRLESRTPSGTTTGAFRRGRSSNTSSIPAHSDGSSITARNSCRTGRFPPTCRRAGEGCGGPARPAAATGGRGGLLAHCIDTALWLNGSVRDVTAMTETFIKERTHALTGRVEPVGIDDASAFLARFQNGSLGLFEATRYARGHKALHTLEINGEHA